MKNKVLSLMLAVLFITATVPSFAYASDGPITETVTYDAESSEKEYDFDKKISKDGTVYKLADVETRVVSEHLKKVEGEVTHIEKSEPVLPGSQHQFAESLETDGVSYRISQINEIKSEPYVQDVSAYMEYEYVISTASVPQTKTVTVKNEKTGQEESVECSISDVRQIGTRWIDSHIDIQFSDYNSTAFLWQGILMENDPSSLPLAGYESELLASVGLNGQTGKVLNTYWTSEAYVKDGLMYRDAKADIEKLVPVYRAFYNGQINTDLVIQEAVYVGQGMVETDELEYTLEATATYEVDHTMQYVLGAFFIVVFIILALFILSKKKKERKCQPENAGNE